MDFSKIPLFTALTKRMAWLGERQKVLAHNIANSDTPNYTPRDLKPVDFRAMTENVSRRVTIKTTNVRHLTGLTPQAKKFEVEVRTGWRETLNIFTVTALPPGNRKSAVFKDAVESLEEFEQLAARA